MQVRNAGSRGDRMKPKDIDGLLACRMSMLGIDLFAIERDKNDLLEEIMRRCASCDYRDACAVDLKRDPNNPVWESYCPNSVAFLELASTSWLLRR